MNGLSQIKRGGSYIAPAPLFDGTAYRQNKNAPYRQIPLAAFGRHPFGRPSNHRLHLVGCHPAADALRLSRKVGRARCPIPGNLLRSLRVLLDGNQPAKRLLLRFIERCTARAAPTCQVLPWPNAICNLGPHCAAAFGVRAIIPDISCFRATRRHRSPYSAPTCNDVQTWVRFP